MRIPTSTLFDIALRAAVAPTAHGIRKTGLCKVSGKHLSEAENTALEPGDLSQADLAEIDRDFAIDKDSGAVAQREADRAQRDEVHMLRNAGFL